VERLQSEDFSRILDVVQQISTVQDKAEPLLAREFSQIPDESIDRKLRTALGLLAARKHDTKMLVEYATDQLLTSDQPRFQTILTSLLSSAQCGCDYPATNAVLWALDRETPADGVNLMVDSDKRFKAACAMATFDPHNVLWTGSSNQRWNRL